MKAHDEVVSLPVQEARWLDEILGLLGMHEEGDPVERVRELLDREISWFRHQHAIKMRREGGS